MRIISGKFKGSLLKFIRSSFTRPLKDSVKENIFNILIHSKNIEVKIDNSNVIDLYSGIGSFGLECLSRGANKVTFIEQNPSVLKILNENLKKLNLENKVRTINGAVDNFCNENVKEKFDILFFDPPYAEKNFLKVMKTFEMKKIFNKKHIFIVHREKGNDENLENNFKILFSKVYGRSKIIFGKFS